MAVLRGHRPAVRLILLLDEVAEVFEFDGEVDVVDHDIVWNVQDDGGEIENASDTGIDQFVGDFLGFGGGDGDDRRFDAPFLEDFGKAIHGIDGSGDRLFAPASRFHVKGADNFETFLFETFIGKERETEIADADEDDGLKAGGAEQVGDHFAELLDIVTETAGAELAEVGQVFAELGGFDAGGFGESLAG